MPTGFGRVHLALLAALALFAAGPARAAVDSDGDGLSDDLEAILGTDPHKADTDGDGVSDGDEYANCSDPLDPSEHLTRSACTLWDDTGNLAFKWSESGPIAGMHCVHVFSALENTWSNTYLCTPHDLGLRWSSRGPIAGLQCLSIREGSDPNWSDGTNYLCTPHAGLVQQLYFWVWSDHFPGDPQKECVPIRNALEPSSHSWGDNWLCAQQSTSGTCAGHCGGVNGGCFCDRACAASGDCCTSAAYVSATCFSPQITMVAQAQAPSGAWIATLTGSDLGAKAGTVAIGGKPCAVSAWSESVIVCTAPPGAGANVPVVVTTKDGLTALAASGFSYPAPVLQSIWPLTLPPSGGTLLLVGSGFGTDSPPLVTVGGVAALVTLFSDATTTVVVPAVTSDQAASWKVQVSAGGQASNTLDLKRDVPVIDTVSPLPLPTAGGVLTIAGTAFGPAPTVTIGGVDCPVTGVTDKDLTCQAAASAPGQVAVVVTGGTLRSVPFRTSYGAATLKTISPSTGPTAGGIDVTLTGTGLIPGGLAVMVGALQATVTSASSTAVTFTLPEGEGSAVPVVVINGGVASNTLLFNYAAPKITSFSPVTGGTAGGTTLTVLGSNFGLTGSIVIGGQLCVRASGNHQQITCTVAAGQGAGKQVTALVAGLESAPATITFSYLTPVITSAAPAGKSSAGGDALTVLGHDFGTSATVLVGGRPCAPILQTQTQLVCALPAGGGVAPLEVVVSGQKAATLYAYSPPVLSGLSPDHGPTAGGGLLTLTGANLGVAPVVTIGGRLCVPSLSTHTQITCTAPPGAGEAQLELVTGNVLATAHYTYDRPLLLSLQPNHGPAGGGNEVLLSGLNLGAGALVEVDGALVTPEVLHDDFAILRMPAGRGGAVKLSLWRSGEATNELTYTYDGPVVRQVLPAALPWSGGALTITGESFGTAPVVTVGGRLCGPSLRTDSLILCDPGPSSGLVDGEALVVTNASASATSTVAYLEPVVTGLSPSSGPTQGGGTLALAGSGLDRPGLLVLVGPSACPVVERTPALLRCTLPAGTGSGLSVVVQRGPAQVAAGLFSYAGPVISNLAPLAGSTQGGVAVTLSGQNFGGAGARLVFGGAAVQATLQTHTQLVFTLPAGQGAAVPVTLTVSGQSATSTYAYAPPVLDSLSTSTLPAAGGPLVLRGANFGTGPTVTVGGAACSVTAATHTQVTCSASAATGPQEVRLDAGGQKSNTLVVTYPAPAIAGVTPAKAPSSGGALLLVSGTGLSAALTVTVGGSACPVLKASPTEVVCRMGSTAPGSAPVMVRAGGFAARFEAFAALPSCGVDLAEGAACDDGDPCTGDGVCKGTACVRGSAANDGAVCAGKDPCAKAGVCAAGRCVPGAAQSEGAACAALDLCTGAGTCQAGVCSAAPASEGLACDDTNGGTVGDRCVAGVCAGVAVDPAKLTGCSSGGVPGAAAWLALLLYGLRRRRARGAPARC